MEVIVTYLKLRYKSINRWILESGLPVFVGYILIALIFLAATVGIFQRFPYPAAVFASLGTLLLFRFNGSAAHHAFLKLSTDRNSYRAIRLVEAFLVVLPFIVILLVVKEWLWPSVLLLISAGSAFFTLPDKPRKAMLTPFYRYPFEFTAGFRWSYPLIVASYMLTGMAVYFGNPGAGIAALVFVFLLCALHYNVVEDRFFVWVYALRPTGFLIQKMKIAVLLTSVVVMPILIAVCWAFPEDVFTFLLVVLAGELFLLAVVLAKYWAFPREANLIQALFVSFAVLVPPLHIVILPFLFYKAKKSLSAILK